MPKEKPKSQADQPLIVPRGELLKRFTPLTPAEVERLGPSKTPKPEARSRPADDIESLGRTFGPFLKDTFKKWGVDDVVVDALVTTPELRELKGVDYSQKKDDIDAAKFGEYILNPDTQDVDWSAVPEEKIKVEKLPPEMEGKSLAEVGEYIAQTYGDKYYLPGLEYYKFILDHPTQAPVALQDGNYHYFYGSLLRNSHGLWYVPCVDWHNPEFDRNAFWLDSAWDANNRVVLLEK